MDYFVEWSNIHDGRLITDGPFPEYVELTHEHLRVGPEGAFIGYIVDGDWWRVDDESGSYTDVVITASLTSLL